ncbi:hypothetical protein [Rahnella variigena]|uniref:Uncharacterized protein n=1 Tax=Rahnella variigena TaxID=574964 RepID=A0ABX9PX31_9GAMM|nr:hypothetical protein [Rahnella variigena]RJT52665.1 hypothetical protein D6D38_14160 [Rahnella variigena]RKF69198.1 hypothetical protein CKQ54_12840 [Rahnella variigena]
MKAIMTVDKLELRNIKSIRDSGKIGHNFDLVAKLKVQSRSMGAFSGEGIDCPDLQWIETVDWYKLDTNTDKWIHVGTNPNNKDLYKANPKSQTFKTWWEEYRYAFARNTKGFPATLKNAHERDVKHWIARNGFEWELPIRDIPSMSLMGGSGGGAGASLVIGDTRRRVIRFELGFTGCSYRIYCAQILETRDGKPSINAFIQRKLSNMDLNNQQNFIDWRKSSRFPQCMS